MNSIEICKAVAHRMIGKLDQLEEVVHSMQKFKSEKNNHFMDAVRDSCSAILFLHQQKNFKKSIECATNAMQIFGVSAEYKPSYVISK